MIMLRILVAYMLTYVNMQISTYANISMETTELEDLAEKKLCSVTNWANYTPKFYGCKSDKFAQVSLNRIYGCEIDK